MLLAKVVPEEYGVRSAFRIPVLPEFNFQSVLKSKDATQDSPLQITSLSLSGLYGEWEAKPQAGEQAIIGSIQNFQLVYKEHDCTVEAVITRVTPEGIAAAFIEQPPTDSLSNLVMDVQRSWITSKAV